MVRLQRPKIRDPWLFVCLCELKELEEEFASGAGSVVGSKGCLIDTRIPPSTIKCQQPALNTAQHEASRPQMQRIFRMVNDGQLRFPQPSGIGTPDGCDSPGRQSQRRTNIADLSRVSVPNWSARERAYPLTSDTITPLDRSHQANQRHGAKLRREAVTGATKSVQDKILKGKTESQKKFRLESGAVAHVH
jgi:hypothetical protein